MSALILLVFATVAGPDADSASAPDTPLPTCGVSSVYACLNCLGTKVSLEDVRQEFLSMGADPKLEDLSLVDLQSVFDRYGYSTTPIRFDVAETELLNLPTPCLLHIDERGELSESDSDSSDQAAWGHYVVLESLDRSSGVGFITDLSVPVVRKEVPLKVMAEYSTGNALIVNSGNGFSFILQITLGITCALLLYAVLSFRPGRATVPNDESKLTDQSGVVA